MNFLPARSFDKANQEIMNRSPNRPTELSRRQVEDELNEYPEPGISPDKNPYSS
jgi:hypothetical protein